MPLHNLSEREFVISKVYSVVFLIYLLGLSVIAFIKPFHNWDMIPYMGIVLSYENSDPQKVYTQTYSELKSTVSADEYALLNSGAYRAGVSSSNEAFQQQLPFYTNRPLYTSLVYLFHVAGVPIINATVLVSILAGIGMALVMYKWLSQNLEPLAALLISLILVPATGILEVMRLSTPDALSSLWLLLCLYMIVHNKPALYIGILGCLSIFTRADNILFMGLVVAFAGFYSNTYRISKKEFLILGICFLLSYFGVVLYFGSYGWETTFYHVFIGRLVTPLTTPHHVSVFMYITTFIKQYVITLLGYYLLPVFLFCAGVVAFSSNIRVTSQSIYKELSLLLLVFFVVRFLIFPDMQNRYFVPEFIMIGIAIAVSFLKKQNDQAVYSTQSFGLSFLRKLKSI